MASRIRTTRKTPAQDGSAGGLVGKSTTNSGSPIIKACANFGRAESIVDTPAGGIIGNVGSEDEVFAITLEDTFNYGNVKSLLAAGGLIGRYCGVASTLRNNGNFGKITSDTGFAGGLVGQISYNGNNQTWRIENALQAGAVSTESGFAGIVAGGIEDSVGSDLAMVVSNVVMAGSVTAKNGGQAGLLIGGRDRDSPYETAFTAEALSVLNSNASLPYYYDKDDDPASLVPAPVAIGPRALRNGVAKKQLDRAAQSNGWMQWIQGRFCPELVLFGTQGSTGLNVAIK